MCTVFSVKLRLAFNCFLCNSCRYRFCDLIFKLHPLIYIISINTSNVLGDFPSYVICNVYISLYRSIGLLVLLVVWMGLMLWKKSSHLISYSWKRRTFPFLYVKLSANINGQLPRLQYGWERSRLDLCVGNGGE